MRNLPKILVIMLSVGVLLHASVLHAQPPGETLQIGWASVDLTPESPVFITGQRHARISEGVMDPITATALALESPAGDGVILVSCDLISIPDELRGDDFRGKVRERVRAALPEGEAPKVVLNGTHTHAGPEVRDRTGLEACLLYLDFGVQIQERSQAVQTFIVQLAGSGTYLAPERAVRGGAYGTAGAYRNHGNIGPEGGRDLVEGTLEMIDALWAPGD